MAVDGKEIDAERMRPGNVPFLLDRVAVGDPASGRTGVERHLDFGDGSAIEARAERSEQLEDLRLRVGLDGIVDRAVGQGVTECTVVRTHDVEVDHEAGTFGTSGIDEVEDTSGGHGSIPLKFQGSRTRRRVRKDKGRREPDRNQPVETLMPYERSKRE
ncbi:hypothetical protein D3C72_1730570 [compost metagenome]